jgi:hypothetical protein
MFLAAEILEGKIRNRFAYSHDSRFFRVNHTGTAKDQQKQGTH